MAEYNPPQTTPEVSPLSGSLVQLFQQEDPDSIPDPPPRPKRVLRNGKIVPLEFDIDSEYIRLSVENYKLKLLLNKKQKKLEKLLKALMYCHRKGYVNAMALEIVKYSLYEE